MTTLHTLHIPDDAKCAVRGCRKEPTHMLSLRMRRAADTGADWAPNLPAYFCTRHATNGARVTLLFEPTNTHCVEANVFSVDFAAERVTPIQLKGN